MPTSSPPPPTLSPSSTTPWVTDQIIFNTLADNILGLISITVFLVGTLGNIISFLYFRSKKRDMSSVTYMLITATDTIISMTVCPVGVSFLSGREPGLFFGNDVICTIWWHIWETALRLSIFLVACMSVTRTIALLKPFYSQKTRYMILAVVISLTLNIVQMTGFQIVKIELIEFDPPSARPVLFINNVTTHVTFQFLMIMRGVNYVFPFITILISCSVAAVILLTKRKEDGAQAVKHQSKKRATITIMLFAMVYFACNIHLVWILFLFACAPSTAHKIWPWFFVHTHGYLNTTIDTLLLAANSAANPVLYFWRMSRLRDFALCRKRRGSRRRKTVRYPCGVYNFGCRWNMRRSSRSTSMSSSINSKKKACGSINSKKKVSTP